MRLMTVLLAIAFTSVTSADELVLKDGKKIEFKTLSDEGDSWLLTTPQGTKIPIKKADFDRLIPSGVKEAPLTGATFTFDKKRKLETIDLLPRIDPKRDGITGNWRLSGGVLVGQGVVNGIAKLQTNYTPPSDEYDLTVVLDRKEGNEIHFGLVGGGHQFNISFDWLECTWSGLWLGDQGPNANGAGVPSKFFTNGKPRTLTFMVRKEALVVQADGKDFLVWKADWPRAQVNPPYAVPSKNSIYLAVGAATFQFSKLTLTMPKEKP